MASENGGQQDQADQAEDGSGCESDSGRQTESPDLDFTDFGLPLFKKKNVSLLDLVQQSSLSVDELKHKLLEPSVDPDEVEERGAGFGAIHYLVTGSHGNQLALITCLVMYGMANIDLTTSGLDQVTALHLACKEANRAAVGTLISLGANVSVPNGEGRTPLDYAYHFQRHPTQETEVPMMDLKKDFEISGIFDFIIDTLTDDKPKADPSLKMQDVIRMLIDVGAKTGGKVLPPPSFSQRSGEKIDCLKFKKMEDVVSKITSPSQPEPSLEEAALAVRTLREQEAYRRRCGSRILCLDGGGVRGLAQMCILREIELRTGKSICELFDWIVGTSTGGIIALALAYGEKGKSPKSVLEVRSKYWQEKDEIFSKSSDDLFAKGNTRKLERVLKNWLGEETKLNQLEAPSPCVLIPAVEKSDSDLQLDIFNNCFGDKYSKEFVWKVARYTSAAPLYFYALENYIDGGLLANNPSAVGLTKIQDFFRERGEKLPISLLVSIGSGQNPPTELGHINVHKNLINFKAWQNFFEVLESALLNKSVHENCRSRCREQKIEYFRFSPQLDQPVESAETDDHKLLNMLYKTRHYLETEREQVDKLVSLLTQSHLTHV